MKNHSLSLLSVLAVSIKLSAQSPILTASNSNPVTGDNFTAQAINYVSPGSAGTSQVWDFSALVSAGTESFSYIDAATAPSSFSFPAATLATLNPATTTNNFYSATSSALYIEGYFYGSPSNQTVPYSDPQQVMNYPFSMGSGFIDNYRGTYISGPSTIIRNGVNTVNADGYGTLILPYGTLSNVLRVAVVDQYTDTTSLGAPYSQFTLETYNWYLPGVHDAVLSLSSLFMNGGTTPVAQFGDYLDQSSVGIIERINESADFSFYPNPVQDKLNLQSAEKIKTVNCVNDVGQSVSVELLTQSINVSSLCKGIYFITIQLENEKFVTGKFIKE
jgi:hypothetical protein